MTSKNRIETLVVNRQMYSWPLVFISYLMLCKVYVYKSWFVTTAGFMYYLLLIFTIIFKTNSLSFYGEVRAKTRKLMGFVQVLDYDYAGPNPKHDPRGKRGGGGGGGSKNP
ncbi:hypothetical protein MIMGU_mgv1a016716mg [Erythranthe guttata]|uniref:Uncharacterized protein n=1 Tax=Erythranthe guttata TaxID=4155 RepID=A0A022QC99_ERYGU|nr:hypothetical protein MIMGU_mgv1a016716mg [Erythranthe guttata]